MKAFPDMSERLVAVKKVVEVLFLFCSFFVFVEFFKRILLVLCLYSIRYLSRVIFTKHLAI